MTPGRRRGVVLALVVLSYVGWAVGLGVDLLVVARDAGAGGPDVVAVLDPVIFSLAWIGLPIVGAVLALRLPGNPVGWMLLLLGFVMYALAWPGAWLKYELATHGTAPWLLTAAAAVVNALAVVPVLAVAVLLLAFPDGAWTGLSRFLRRVAVAATVVVTVVRLLRPGRLDMEPFVANPLAVTWLPAGEEVVGLLSAVVFAVALVALVRLGLRHRRAQPVERKQLQWILASLATFPVLWVLGNAVEGVNYAVGQLTAVSAFALGFLGFTAALYRAVTRHDLYGIDRLVSRTITYAVLVGVLVATYLGLVLALGQVARALTGETGDLVVALSTLGAAAVAQPARRRVQKLVDRRFNRARYDAARTIDDFGRGLRDEVSLATVAEALRHVTAETFRPASIGVVLVARGGPP